MSKFGKALRIIWQVGLLSLIALVGNELVSYLHWKIPGNVMGLMLLLLLLATGVIPLKWVDVGGDWLLAEMLLFFIPATVGIIQYKALLAQDGWRLLLVIGLSTVSVMAGTGLVAERITRRRSGEKEQSNG